MTILTPFNSHLKAIYDHFWDTADSARVILVGSALSEASNLSAVLAAELPTANGYTVGGDALEIHASTVDASQSRTEGRPAAVSFTASGSGLTFTGFAVIATRSSVDELCLFHNYASTQTIPSGDTREILLEINLGNSSANVEAA